MLNFFGLGRRNHCERNVVMFERSMSMNVRKNVKIYSIFIGVCLFVFAMSPVVLHAKTKLTPELVEKLIKQRVDAFEEWVAVQNGRIYRATIDKQWPKEKRFYITIVNPDRKYNLRKISALSFLGVYLFNSPQRPNPIVNHQELHPDTLNPPFGKSIDLFTPRRLVVADPAIVVFLVDDVSDAIKRTHKKYTNLLDLGVANKGYDVRRFKQSEKCIAYKISRQNNSEKSVAFLDINSAFVSDAAHKLLSLCINNIIFNHLGLKTVSPEEANIKLRATNYARLNKYGVPYFSGQAVRWLYSKELREIHTKPEALAEMKRLLTKRFEALLLKQRAKSR